MLSLRPTDLLSDMRVQAGERWRYAERHRLDSRVKGAACLVVVIAGHKPALWPLTLERFARDVPQEWDVCVVTPGLDHEVLARRSAERGWSYLSTGGGHVSVAQNLAIRAHPAATHIVKVDEDIFVGEGFFQGLLDGHERVKREAEFAVGFVAPLLNVNGFSYVDYVRYLGCAEEYATRFGPLRRASDGIPAQNDGAAAVWLWEQGLPVDKLASRFAARPFGLSIVPHRFSIGAILYEREVWEEMRGFKRLERAPGLGEDEQHLCVSCLSRSRIMVVLDDVYAGHFAFGSQVAAMEAAFGQRLADF